MITTTYLYVPGNKLEFVAKGIEKGADKIIIDLEDSIPISIKDEVRTEVCNFLKNNQNNKCFVRVNSIDNIQSKDVEQLIKIGHQSVVIPKVENESYIIKSGSYGKFKNIIVLVETALGMNQLIEIGNKINITGVGIGEVDFSADLRILEDENTLKFYRSNLVYISRILNLPKPIGGVYKNFNDDTGLKNFGNNLKNLGFGSLQLIHPNQIDVVKNIFTPTKEEIKEAENLLKTISEHEDSGVGVFVGDDGSIVDAAMIRKAKEILKFNEK
tara:strand:- start:363 stop:1175 length:813 start_codon:yes stop_codon:yes gene_type:complete